MIYVMNTDKDSYKSTATEMLPHINVGSGLDLSMAVLTETISGYN
jgi:hypothetical protein